MQTDYYPENLLKDYNLLLEYFPSHTICRPFVVSEIKKWKDARDNDGMISILEVGPGYGETTELILNEVPCNITLIELDKVASSILSTNLDKYKKQIKILNENALTWITSVPSESYDVFTASWVLHNFPSNEREAFLAEIRRVLKPGGLFVIFDKVLVDDDIENERLKQVRMKRLEGLDALGRSDLKNEMFEHEERDRKPPFAWHEKNLFETMNTLGYKEHTIAVRNEDDIVFSAKKS